MHWFYHAIRDALLHYGYWAVLGALLAEDAGIPVPGETTLLFASFLAHKTGHLQIIWIIFVGVGAATLGDNLGFFVGRKLGWRLIHWMKTIFRLDDVDIKAARNMTHRHGGKTIFWARFIF